MDDKLDEISRIAKTNSNTHDDNLDCDKQDDNELHASARCLRRLERSYSCGSCRGRNNAPHVEAAEEQIAAQPHTLSYRSLHASEP
jgi:hypothetical protein